MASNDLLAQRNNFKTAAAYALSCREACRPDACIQVERCWVALGTIDSVTRNAGGTPRCLACNGTIKQGKRG